MGQERHGDRHKRYNAEKHEQQRHHVGVRKSGVKVAARRQDNESPMLLFRKSS